MIVSSTLAIEGLGDNRIDTAISHPQRSAEDRRRDSYRSPKEVLNFFGISQNQIVVDILAGSGYYSELLSHVVGDKGRVVLHNDAHFLAYYGESLANRLGGDNRLANIERIDIPLNRLTLEEDSVDAVLIILGFHDFYYEMEGAEKIEVKKVLSNIRFFLKPDGILGVVDHEAVSGAPASVGNTLHRIDPEIVISEMELAGFEVTGHLPILTNVSDDKAKKIWDVAEGKTSRFVLRFANKK
jgi:predicted methyltransferase